MSIRKRVILRLAAVMMMTIMVFGSASSAFAAVPTKDEIEYDGAGRVEVEFRGKVDWRSPKVTVTDTTGKKYTATIVKKDNDDITFKVNNYKEGTKYNFSISGVKARGTTGYGTFKGTFTIPKAVVKKATATTKPAATKPATTKPATTKPATTKPAATKPAATKPATTKPAATKPATTTATISQSTAKTTAINNAVSLYKAQKSTVREYEIESDRLGNKAVWEVSFEARRTGYNGWYEFEFKIDKATGKVLSKKVERD